MSVSKLGVRSCGYMRYHRFLFTLTVIASSIIYLQRFFFFIFTLMFEAIFLNMLFWHIMYCTQKYALTEGKSESFIVNKIVIITICAQPFKDRCFYQSNGSSVTSPRFVRGGGTASTLTGPLRSRFK